MRLGKYLAHAGIASRRASEQLVFDGRVSVGGEIVRDPARDVDDASGVAVDGGVLATGKRSRVVYVVHKPEGVVSTASDPQGRPTVVGLVDTDERLYPVGRLDIDTTGLILLTNDGDLADRLTHPRYGVSKTYVVTVTNPPVRQNRMERLSEGIVLDDGPTLPARARKLSPTQFELIIREGRKRQVRRMTEAVGYKVKALERVQFGPLRLGPLAPGGHRRLKHPEVEELRAAVPREFDATRQTPGPSAPSPRAPAPRSPR